MTLAIGAYELIGEWDTAALGGRDSPSDRLCWRRFNSDGCFRALLGTADNGRWLIAPPDGATRRSRRRYRDETLVLEAECETEDGVAVLVDFMPPRGRNSDIVRIVEGRRGRV